MKNYRAIIHESFKDDTTNHIPFDDQNLEQVIALFGKLDGKSFPALQVFLSDNIYPHLYVIGGPDLFTLSLTRDEGTWQETRTNPDPDTSKWRAFGLGYHNYEFLDDELLNKQVTVRAIKHICMTGEWPIDIPSKINDEDE